MSSATECTRRFIEKRKIPCEESTDTDMWHNIDTRSRNVVIEDRTSAETKATACRWFSSQGRLWASNDPIYQHRRSCRNPGCLISGGRRHRRMTLPSRQDQRTLRRTWGKEKMKGGKRFNCHVEEKVNYGEKRKEREQTLSNLRRAKRRETE